MYSVIF